MKSVDTREVKKRIRALLYHMGALQGSYPQVLHDDEYARAHLLILRRVLPQLMHVLRFTSELVPLIEKVAGVAGQGSARLGDVSRNLRSIDSAAENAVQEILGGLEQVEEELRKVQAAAGSGEQVESAVEAVSARVTEIFGALQFQDITSQRIEATHALLAQLEQGLRSLADHLGMAPEDAAIEVHEGTYDARAAYEPEKAPKIQAAVDAVMEAMRAEGGAAAAAATEAEQAGEGAEGSQDDIDDLMDGRG